MNRYLIIIEETGTGYSAYSPDLPGCVATGAARDSVEREMHHAIEFHLEGLRRAENRFRRLAPKHRTAK
jgi:predicted RNase H-like HicB family nuclease